MHQHDSRHAFPAEELVKNDFYGLMVNVKSNSKSAWMLRLFKVAEGRHWFSIIPLVSVTARLALSESLQEEGQSTEPTAPNESSDVTELSLEEVDFALLDSLKPQPVIMTGRELLERLQQLLHEGGYIYIAKPAEEGAS